VQHAAKLLTEVGHTVEPAEIEALRDPEWVPRFLTIWVVGVAIELDEAARDIGRAINPAEIETLTYALGELGRMVTGPAYAEAWRWIHRASTRGTNTRAESAPHTSRAPHAARITKGEL